VRKMLRVTLWELEQMCGLNSANLMDRLTDTCDIVRNMQQFLDHNEQHQLLTNDLVLEQYTFC
jgi:hypothetical protein